MNKIFINKLYRILKHKADALLGYLFPLNKTLYIMSTRPYELHLELTDLCNAKCALISSKKEKWFVEKISQVNLFRGDRFK